MQILKESFLACWSQTDKLIIAFVLVLANREHQYKKVLRDWCINQIIEHNKHLCVLLVLTLKLPLRNIFWMQREWE